MVRSIPCMRIVVIPVARSGLRVQTIPPSAVVIVATVRALKYNGGIPKNELTGENLDALKKGIVNLEKHINNIQSFGVPVIVTLNEFLTDTEAELAFVEKFCRDNGCEFARSKVWAEGGKGGKELAEAVLKTLETKESAYAPIYDTNLPIKDKIRAIATKIYGASDVAFSDSALKEIEHLNSLGFSNLPICMAKTQYSLSDDPKKLGRPHDFVLNIRDVYVSAGAGFIVALTGTIMTMPGLPKTPAAYSIDVDENGEIIGLF